MPPRSARQTTGTLLVRGALCKVLSIPLAKTVVAATSDSTETICVKAAAAPSEEQMKRVFDTANRLVEDEERVLVVDVPLPITLQTGETWVESRLACEYLKFKGKDTDKVVRFGYLDEFAYSAIPHDGTQGGHFLEHVGACGKLKLIKYSFNDKRGELTVEYELPPPTSSGTPATASLQLVSALPEKDLLKCVEGGASEGQFEEEEEDGQPTGGDGKKEQVITPWTVEGDDETGVDYDKLVVSFGCEKIDQGLLDLFREVTGQEPHPWLRRGIFFSHRDLKDALNAKKAGKPFYLYTGRGPSSESLHFGHLIPFMFTSWLQRVFDCPLVIQLTDDEKFLFQKDANNPKPLDEFQRLGYENARDIMAVGFNPKKTFIFLNTEYIGHMYPLVVEIQKNVTFNQTRGIFGFHGSSSCGQIAFPAIQAAPSFSEAFPCVLRGMQRMTCLIPCAIDQDPYFRMTRDVAKKIGLKKPALIHAKFFPALQGANAKMSGSVSSSAVMVSDDDETIRKKISAAFSGGRSGPGQQELLGADLDVDIAYQWLRFFLFDDAELERIARLYGPGELRAGEKRMYTVEIKKILSDLIIKMAREHRERKAALTQEQLNEVFKVRPLL